MGLADPLRRACPTCGQLPGQLCHDTDGHLMEEPHRARLLAPDGCSHDGTMMQGECGCDREGPLDV